MRATGRLLALDLSLAATGWVLLSWNELAWQVLGSGVIRPRGAPQSLPERTARIDFISKEVLKLAGVAEFNPVDAVWIEEMAFSRHNAHAHSIGELHGVVLVDLRRARVETLKVGIGAWRKRVLGKGNLSKGEVRVEVLKRYGAEFKSEDECEAFGVAMYGYLEATAQNKPAAKGRYARAATG